MIELSIDAKALDDLAKRLQATPDEVAAAFRSTLQRMTSWLRRRVIAELSKDLSIGKEDLARRVKSTRVQLRVEGAQARVWVGLNPIGWEQLDPYPTTSGVAAAGGRSRDKAFVARGKASARLFVFRRREQARLPIDKVSERIDESGEKYLASLVDSPEFSIKYYETFARELQWKALSPK